PRVLDRRLAHAPGRGVPTPGYRARARRDARAGRLARVAVAPRLHGARSGAVRGPLAEGRDRLPPGDVDPPAHNGRRDEVRQVVGRLRGSQLLAGLAIRGAEPVERAGRLVDHPDGVAGEPVLKPGPVQTTENDVPWTFNATRPLRQGTYSIGGA